MGDVFRADLSTLLADRLRVLGPDHPHTLITRHDLAYWHGETGDAPGAVTAFEAALLTADERAAAIDTVRKAAALS